LELLTTGKSGKGVARVGGSGGTAITGGKESKSRGTTVSTRLKGRENSAEIEGMDSGREG